MAFLDDLTEDLEKSFFNTEEFGERVTLHRGDYSFSMNGLYDSPSGTVDNGIDIGSIDHYPRLYVRQCDLPGGEPRKGDDFTLSENQFHSSLSLRAIDFVFEKNGTVIYRCKLV